MKPTSEILERIEKCSSEHKDGDMDKAVEYLRENGMAKADLICAVSIMEWQ